MAATRAAARAQIVTQRVDEHDRRRAGQGRHQAGCGITGRAEEEGEQRAKHRQGRLTADGGVRQPTIHGERRPCLGRLLLLQRETPQVKQPYGERDKDDQGVQAGLQTDAPITWRLSRCCPYLLQPVNVWLRLRPWRRARARPGSTLSAVAAPAGCRQTRASTCPFSCYSAVDCGLCS